MLSSFDSAVSKLPLVRWAADKVARLILPGGHVWACAHDCQAPSGWCISYVDGPGACGTCPNGYLVHYCDCGWKCFLAWDCGVNCCTVN